MRSFLEIWRMAEARAEEVLAVDRLIEAPNWDPDGRTLLVNGDGHLFRVPLEAPELIPVETGIADRCNNDHGISPDGRTIVISHNTPEGSAVYTLPAGGGAPVRITEKTPSYWHGWSPDGSTLAYVAKRGKGHFDVYTCPVTGGAETRLTFGEGHCDGPDYSPDGTWIYYNCDRTGQAQIWRMKADGTAHAQLFADGYVNWFPHPSPDGRTLLYLAYPAGTTGHPKDRPVALCLCDMDGANRRRVREFTGGQGTINVPCWAPDGSAFAYVRYEP
jgi:Tol biopolymer transport system component